MMLAQAIGELQPRWHVRECPPTEVDPVARGVNVLQSQSTVATYHHRLRPNRTYNLDYRKHSIGYMGILTLSRTTEK